MRRQLDRASDLGNIGRRNEVDAVEVRTVDTLRSTCARANVGWTSRGRLLRGRVRRKRGEQREDEPSISSEHQIATGQNARSWSEM